MRVQDVVVPQWELLLVELDDRPQFSQGGLHLPGTAKLGGASRMGRILRCGSDVPLYYQPGMRVSLSAYAGIKANWSGETKSEIAFVGYNEVQAVWLGEPEDPDPLRWEKRKLWGPPSGHHLVERSRLTFGLIQPPDEFMTTTRAAEAAIHATASDLTTSPFRDGQAVLLSSGVSHGPAFGTLGEDRLYACSPRQILATIAADAALEVDEADPRRFEADLPARTSEQSVLDEGEPGALR